MSKSSAHFVLLILVLCGVWMVWSGHVKPLMLGFGVASVALTVWMSKRLDVIDEEGQPLNYKILLYLPWLIKEIIVANIDVLKRILISGSVEPTWIKVPTKQKTRLGRVIFANSITLTPGTVSVVVDSDYILVNAVSKEGAESLIDGGEMGQKVCGLED